MGDIALQVSHLGIFKVLPAVQVYATDKKMYIIYPPFAESAKALQVGQLVVLEEIEGGYRIKDENNTTDG